MRPSDHERYEMLLVRAVDGLLDAADQAELDSHLENCASCRTELDDFQLIKQATDGLRARIWADAQIEPPRLPRAAGATIGLGFALLLVGCALLVGFAAYTWVVAHDVPVVVKVGAGAAAAGVLLLLGYVLGVRWRAHRRDPYEEIDQ